MTNPSGSADSVKPDSLLPRIYLDNAATSWPKPQTVPDAISRYYQESGTPAFRGSSGLSSGTDGAIDRCRKRLASFIGAKNKNELVFAFNGTDALNIAIQGVLGANDHVVTTCLEHNSVLRPLNRLAEERSIDVTYVAPQSNGVVNPDTLLAALRDETRLVIVTHASNVTGVVQPVEEIGERLRDFNSMYLVDAAQSLGQIPIDVEAIHCDMLAAPGHKGLYGPLGTGLLYLDERIWNSVRPLRLGGTGTESDSNFQPDQMPARFESGNLNVGGIVGLEAGLEFVLNTSLSAIHDKTMNMVDQAINELEAMENVETYCIDAPERMSVFSFNIKGQDPRDVGAILDTSFGIQTRAGFHCAPSVHRELGTFDLGGTVRISLGCFNTLDEIKVFIDAVRQIAET